MVLQKVPASSPNKAVWDSRVESYAINFPNADVVDLPSAVRRVANRETMLDAMCAVESLMNGSGEEGAKATTSSEPSETTSADHACIVRAPRQIVATPGSEEEVRDQCDAASLRFPLLAKSLKADGTSDSHKVAIVHDQDGLGCIARGTVPGLKPPCVIQEYVNHGGQLFKVYVVGEDVVMTRRKSLPDLRGARKASRRRRAAAEKADREMEKGDLGASGGSSGVGGKLNSKRSGSLAKEKDTEKDFDGDVDDSDADEGDDDELFTGAQSVDRVSCFRGGATTGEKSWRDRLTDDELRRMSSPGNDTSGKDDDGVTPSELSNSEIESPSPLRLLPKSFAKNLTISRIGSVDSIGTDRVSSASLASDFPSVGRGLDGEGDNAYSTSPTLGNGRTSPMIGNRPRRSSGGVPPLAPGVPGLPPGRSMYNKSVHQRARDSGSIGQTSDFNFTTSDGGTESEAGEMEMPSGLRVKTTQDPSYIPEKVGNEPESNGAMGKQSSVFQEHELGKKNSNGTKVVPAPGNAFVKTLALTLRDELQLKLFNFDLIRVDGDKNEFLVVDINYFPGIAKMPGYSDAFTRFLTNAKNKSN